MFQSINRTRQLFLYDLIVREHPDLYRKYGEELFCLLNANGPAWAWDLPTCWIDPYERLLNATQKPPSEDFAQLKEAHEALNRAHGEAHRALQWHQHEREHLLRTIENLRAQNATQSKS